MTTLNQTSKPKRKGRYLLGDFLMITLGVAFYTLGWTGFILPHEITTGGLAGITTILQIVTGIPVAIPYNLINIGLLVISIIFLGWRFSLKTVIGVGLLAIFIPLGQALFTLPSSTVYQNLWPWLTNIIPNVGPLLQEEKFLGVVTGGILCGVGLFCVFHVNGSTGGTDIIVALFNKYKNISLGRALILIDATIISTSFLVNVYLMGKPLPIGIELLTFSAVEIIFCSITLDYLTNSNKQSIQIFIFSRRYQEINDAIVKKLGRGATLIHAEGGFSGTESKILMVVVRKSLLRNVNRMIKDIDPKAFVSQGNVHGVYGEGFDTLK